MREEPFFGFFLKVGLPVVVRIFYPYRYVSDKLIVKQYCCFPVLSTFDTLWEFGR